MSSKERHVLFSCLQIDVSRLSWINNIVILLTVSVMFLILALISVFELSNRLFLQC